MKKIIFLAILGALLLQGCNTAGQSKVAASTGSEVGKAAAASEAAAAASAASARQAVKTNYNLPAIQMDPKIIFSSSARGNGNCSACHSIPANPALVAGDMGPPMIGMKERFPDIKKLRAAIADQRVFAPDTIMPPFGRMELLTPAQIDALTTYLYTL